MSQQFRDTKDAIGVTSLLFNYPLCTFYYMLYYTDTLSTLSLIAIVCLAPTKSSGLLAKFISLLVALNK